MEDLLEQEEMVAPAPKPLKGRLRNTGHISRLVGISRVQYY